MKSDIPMIPRLLLLLVPFVVAPLTAQKTPPKKADLAVNEPVVLGQTCDAKGADKEFVRGLQLYLDMINAKGGVGGRRLELTTLDDGGSAKRALQNARKLLDKPELGLLVGFGAASTTKDVLKAVRRQKVPLYAPRSLAAKLRRSRDVFSFRPSLQRELEQLVAWLVNTRKLDKIGCLFPKDDTGRAMFKRVHDVLVARGLSTVSSGSFPRGTDDVRSALESIAGKPPQAVIMFGGAKALARFATLARGDKDLKNVQLVATSTTDPRAYAAAAEAAADETVFSCVVPYPWDAFLPVHLDYKAAMKAKKWEKEVSFGSLEGWLTARFLADVVEWKLGDAPARTEFARAVREMGTWELDGIKVVLGRKDHTASDEIWLVRTIAKTVEPMFLGSRPGR